MLELDSYATYSKYGIAGLLIGVHEKYSKQDNRTKAFYLIKAGQTLLAQQKKTSPSLALLPQIALDMSRHDSVYRMAGLMSLKLKEDELAFRCLVYLYHFYKQNNLSSHPQFQKIFDYFCDDSCGSEALKKKLADNRELYLEEQAIADIKNLGEVLPLSDPAQQKSFFRRVYRYYGLFAVIECIKSDIRFTDLQRATLYIRAGKALADITERKQGVEARFANLALRLLVDNNLLTSSGLSSIYQAYLRAGYLNLPLIKSTLRQNQALFSVHSHFDLWWQFFDPSHQSIHQDKYHRRYLQLLEENNLAQIADEVYGRFSHRSINKLIEYVNFELPFALDLQQKQVQHLLLLIGRHYANNNDKLIEAELARTALLIEWNEMSVRGAFWAYQRCGWISESKRLLLWLQEYAHTIQSGKLTKFVNSRLKSYAFLDRTDLEVIIENFAARGQDSYQPNKDNMLYVLHNSLPYASGGYATRGHGLATALAENGLSVTILTRPGFPLDTKKELSEEDIVLSETIDGVIYQRIISPRRDQVPTYDYLLQAAEVIYEECLRLKPSFIVAASNHLTAFPALMVAKRLGIPFIYEIRGFWEVTRASREPEFAKSEWYQLISFFEAFTANQADHVFTLTTPMKEELMNRGVNADSITILPNSCNPERFEPSGRDIELAESLNIPSYVPVIGYIGTFVQYEGLEHLAEACGLLKQRGIEFRLLIVGNENTAGNDTGPITQHILDVAQQYGFKDWLIMPGRVPHEEVEAYYSLIDIAPFPRKPQPVTEMVSPMKPLEASAMKKAIVVSSVRALVDMIEDGYNGLVFEKGNVEDFADKLYQLVESPQLRKELGEHARHWVENERTWQRTSKKFTTIIDCLDEVKDHE